MKGRDVEPVIFVRDNHATIQEAIDAAHDGDVIFVCPSPPKKTLRAKIVRAHKKLSRGWWECLEELGYCKGC